MNLLTQTQNLLTQAAAQIRALTQANRVLMAKSEVLDLVERLTRQGSMPFTNTCNQSGPYDFIEQKRPKTPAPAQEAAS